MKPYVFGGLDEVTRTCPVSVPYIYSRINRSPKPQAPEAARVDTQYLSTFIQNSPGVTGSHVEPL